MEPHPNPTNYVFRKFQLASLQKKLSYVFCYKFEGLSFCIHLRTTLGSSTEMCLIYDKGNRATQERDEILRLDKSTRALVLQVSMPEFEFSAATAA